MYDLINQEKTQLSTYHVNSFFLPSYKWTSYPNKVSLTWTTVKFSRSLKDTIPDDKIGVYTFIVKPEIANHPECSYLLYVGKVQAEKRSLRQRFQEYLYEMNPQRKGRFHIQTMVRNWEDFLWFCYATVSDNTVIKDLENALITAFIPPFNDNFPGNLGQARKALLR